MDKTQKHRKAADGPPSRRAGLVVRIKVPAGLVDFFRYVLRWRVTKKLRSLIEPRLPKVRSSVYKRVGWGIVAAVMALTVITGIFELRGPDYNLSSMARSLLREPVPYLAQSLEFDRPNRTYEYNKAYQPGQGVAGQTAWPKFKAGFGLNPEDGAMVTDPVNNVSVKFKPKYGLAEPKQDQNRLIYPLKGRDAHKVYTLQASGFKEDIILNSFQKDSMEFKYTLELAAGTEARMEPDGSLSIYGVDSMLLGNVTAASEKDQELLNKARENGEKTNLLFRFPEPFVKEYGKNTSQAKAWFELKGDELILRASGLKEANYPLSIDPSVYVETATKLMRGNNETNIDFDVDNELIQKGSTTGARFDELTASMSLPAARWNHGTTVAGGNVYVVGGSNGSSNQATVYWAKFDTNNYDIDSPNPGAGVCTNWCTDSAYNLPASRVALSLVAYNGYLYAIGGEDSSCTVGNGTGVSGVCDTVYITKLGANGEPSLWHPSDSNKANWVYWYRDADLSSTRSYSAAVAYDNRMYLLGGKTDTDVGGVDTVEYVDIKPMGTLTSWTTTGMTVLPSDRFAHGAHIYNGFMYLIGGNSAGTIQDTVEYIKIKDDGTLISSWSTANDFVTPRMSWGGSFSTIWGAYLYISGGCSAIDAEGECTSTGISNAGTPDTNGEPITSTSVEVASINADGSIAFWGSINNVTNTRIGYGLAAWRNTVYTIGGCTDQNTTTGACTTTSAATTYGIINGDGDASTVATSEGSGTAPCSGSEPYNCDLPGTSNIGNMLNSTAIMNGYLYIIGGCTNTSCSTVSGNTIYTAIGSDGYLRAPASCPGGTIVDAYCVDSTDPISGGVAAAGTAVFGGHIYVVGGQNGSGLKGNIYHVGVNNDGSLEGSWTAQTFTSVAATSVSYTFAYARANPSAAATYPGNLFIFGGCTSGSGIGCSSGANTEAVYKCNIEVDGNLETDDSNDCDDDTDQLQIGVVPGSTDPGLALHAGTVYANYIYLIGGVAPNGNLDLRTLRYAKFDNNNDVVAASGSGWAEPVDSNNDPVEMSIGRRRGTAFGYNGYLYAVGGYDAGGGGVLSDIQFAKINVSDGNLEQFDISAVTINQRWGLSVPVSNSYAYVIGGCTNGTSPTCNSGGPTDMIQTFQIYNNDSGTPADYSSASNLFDTDRFGVGSAIYNGYIYVAGGCIGAEHCDNATNQVEYAQLDENGIIGDWNPGGDTAASLPADRVYGQLEVAGGTLYYIGGQDDLGDAQSEVYYATPASNGDIASWSTASGGLGETTSTAEVNRTQFGSAVWNDRIYVVGGYDDTNAVTSTVFISPQLSSGGDIANQGWTTGTAVNVARNGHTVVAYANNLYVIGGHDGINFLSDVQFTQINSDGTIDSWSYTTSLPRSVSHADGFAANGYMYIFGGKQSEINCTTNTYVAPISANTTIATGNNPTGIGEWFLTNERFSAERSGVSASYHEGKAYLLGGACGTLDGGPGSNVIEDDFDAAIDGSMWTSTANMLAGTTCGTLSSGNALYSTGDNDAIAETIDVDVIYGGTISFYLRIPTGTGSCDPPEGGEDLVLQYSNNSGSGWTTIATYDESNFNTATLITETIPSAARTNSTRFRWYIPNADNNVDEWAIDDVVVEANATPPLDEIMEDDFDATLDAADWTSTTGMTEGTVCGTLSSGNALYSSSGGNTSQAITDDLNLQWGGVVSFVLRIPTSSAGGCDQPEADEDLVLQYSTNSGSSWTTFATYDQALYDTATTVNTAIPTAANSSSVRFRWYIPNADSASDNWAIDDVSISAFEPILTYTGIHRVVYTTLLSQPQVAKYSRMIDTDTDVFPTHWLLNGVDNFIGARWSMRYRTMNDADGVATDCGTADMTTWGQDTDFGEVTLSQPEDYIPLDGSGNDINCARYFYMFVTVDSSQAYGYPDDVTRGPTITDLSLFFTSDPSKRLRHGKTFTGGEQQPFDTPF